MSAPIIVSPSLDCKQFLKFSPWDVAKHDRFNIRQYESCQRKTKDHTIEMQQIWLKLVKAFFMTKKMFTKVFGRSRSEFCEASMLILSKMVDWLDIRTFNDGIVQLKKGFTIENIAREIHSSWDAVQRCLVVLREMGFVKIHCKKYFDNKQGKYSTYYALTPRFFNTIGVKMSSVFKAAQFARKSKNDEPLVDDNHYVANYPTQERTFKAKPMDNTQQIKARVIPEFIPPATVEITEERKQLRSEYVEDLYSIIGRKRPSQQ